MTQDKSQTHAVSPTPVALVTGGGRRIGRAICEDLAANGFAVAIHCNRNIEEGRLLASALQAEGARAAAFAADLTRITEVEGLIDAVTAGIGAPSLLVNNASLFEADSLQDFTWEAYRRHFALHVEAPLELSRRFAAALGGREGLVVNIVDQRVWRPTPLYFSYALSKAAMWDATRLMALSLGPNVRVNAIGPGPTLANANMSAEDFAKQKASLLLERGPDLAEFGATIRYLWQAKSVTGQMIALDGGQHLAWQTPDIVGVSE